MVESVWSGPRQLVHPCPSLSARLGLLSSCSIRWLTQELGTTYETTSPPERAAAISREKTAKPKVQPSPFVPRYNRFSPIANLHAWSATWPRSPTYWSCLSRGPDFAKEDSAAVTRMKTMLTAWP